jgi:hypothetical protein
MLKSFPELLSVGSAPAGQAATWKSASLTRTKRVASQKAARGWFSLKYVDNYASQSDGLATLFLSRCPRPTELASDVTKLRQPHSARRSGMPSAAALGIWLSAFAICCCSARGGCTSESWCTRLGGGGGVFARVQRRRLLRLCVCVCPRPTDPPLDLHANAAADAVRIALRKSPRACDATRRKKEVDALA